VENLITVSHIVGAHVEDHKKIWHIGTPSLRIGCVSDLYKYVLPNKWYHFKFGRSRSNGLVRNYLEIFRKFDASRPAFQRQSRSLELTLLDVLPRTS